MSATQSAPRDGCIAPGGFAAARPSKGQGYFRTSFIRLTSLSRGFGSIGRPPEHRTVHPHAMHDNGQFSGDGNLRLLQAVSFGAGEQWIERSFGAHRANDRVSWHE